MACAKVISEFEVLSVEDAARRRDWTDEDKVRIVEESLRGHRQGSATARRHGLSRSLLTRWRSEYRASVLGPVGSAVFAPVAVTPEVLPVSQQVIGLLRAGPELTIEIALANGRRVTVPARIDPAVLARLLSVLDGV
jgi:transposase